MKKMLILLLVMTFLAVALEGFTVTAFAESENSRTFDVNAVEYEDEEKIEESEDTINTDLITEEEARNEAEKLLTGHESNQTATVPNPSTGVIIAVIPAVIALAVLIILWIIKKKSGRK